MSLDKTLAKRLEQQRQQQLYRQRLSIQSPQQPYLSIAGKSCLAFTSNDYLGLANHPRLIQTMAEAAKQYGVGSGASHLVVGHHEVHTQLEQALATLTGRSHALLFANGYMANMGVINSLLERQDAVFQDRLNHASLLDAGLLSRAKMHRYKHTDLNDLHRQLQLSSARHKLVATDSVFSMDGDMAPLQGLANVCQQQDAWLMLDDAHGLGVLGKQGAGAVIEAGLTQTQAQVYMGTLGKALGCYGAFVAGSQTLIESLMQFSRNYIYTTALPPAIAASALVAVQLLQEESWRQNHLHHLIKLFRQAVSHHHLPVMDSVTPIQPVLVYDAGKALVASQKLQDAGLLVRAIRPPTVPANSARLRITLSAAHTEAHIQQLVEAMVQLKHEGVIPKTGADVSSKLNSTGE